MRYILYARKSSENKEKQIASIADQISECTKHAEFNNLNIVETITESKSAFKPGQRDGFDKMVELILSKQADAIITWKPDRLTRNPKEGGEILQILQDGQLQEIRTPLGEVYTQDSDHLVLQIHFGMSNQYSRNLSQNVKRGLDYKVGRGEFYRVAPLGYENFGEKGKRNIRANSIEGPKMIELFEQASLGRHSLEQLAEYAGEVGLRNRSGLRISKSQIHRYLKNPVYMGYFYFKGELYKGNFEPLVNEDLFERVQKVLGEKSRPQKKTGGHPFNGLFKCGECGYSITTTFTKKISKKGVRVYTYHGCHNRRCSQKKLPLTTQELEKIIDDVIGEITIPEDFWRESIEDFKSAHEGETEKVAGKIIDYNLEIGRLNAKINNLITMRADNEINSEEFMELKNQAVEEKTKFLRLSADLQDRGNNWVVNAENFLNTCFEAKNIIQDGTYEQKRDLVLAVTHNFLIEDRKAVVTLKKPFDVMVKVSNRSLWRGRRDSDPRPLQ